MLLFCAQLVVIPVLLLCLFLVYFLFPRLFSAHLKAIQSVSLFKAGFLRFLLAECSFPAISSASLWVYCCVSSSSLWFIPSDSWLFCLFSKVVYPSNLVPFCLLVLLFLHCISFSPSLSSVF